MEDVVSRLDTMVAECQTLYDNLRAKHAEHSNAYCITLDTTPLHNLRHGLSECLSLARSGDRSQLGRNLVTLGKTIDLARRTFYKGAGRNYVLTHWHIDYEPTRRNLQEGTAQILEILSSLDS